MTITVVTPDLNDYEFSADDWDVNDDGTLWVGTDGEGVAQFAPGAWLFVYETKKEDGEEVKPRVWESVYDIPPGTKVIANNSSELNVLEDGTAWWGPTPEPEWVGWGLTDFDELRAPFTEVLEGK